MNPEKSLIKLSIMNDFGVELEDQLEALQQQISSDAGAKKALLDATSTIEELLFVVIPKEIASGDLSPANAIIAKKYVSKCIEFLRGYTTALTLTYTENRGKHEAFTITRDRVKVLHDEEKVKLDNYSSLQKRLESEESKTQNMKIVRGKRHGKNSR